MPSPTASPAAPPSLATEDPAAYQRHCRQFFDEYQPATYTETQLTQELADTAWRLNRIPMLEAELLDRAANPPPIKLPLTSISSTPTAPSPPSACTPSVSPASSKKPWINCEKFKRSGDSSKNAISNEPRPFWNSTNTKDSPTIQFKMGSFFQKTKLKYSPNA